MKALIRTLLVLVVALWGCAATAGEAEWKAHMDAGLASVSAGDHKGAAARFEAAVREARFFGDRDPRYAVSLYRLAVAYHQLGRYVDAEPLYKQALSLTEKIHGPEHPFVATELNDMATLYLDQGRVQPAEPLLKR